MAHVEERITDVVKINKLQVERIFAAGKTPTLQFSEACYSKSVLTKIDKLCEEYGAKIEVRFYGHYSKGFDASVLQYLPSVASLSVDCLQSATNLVALSKLACLRKLSLGVYFLDDAAILSKLNLAKLEELAIGESKKKDIDVSPLATCGRLKELRIAGHTTNLEVVGRLRSLKSLTLRSISNTQNLKFLNTIATLRRLKIILGGRRGINEIKHRHLEDLEIVWVRGFEDGSFPSNFPGLRRLAIQDQIKLKTITFTSRSARLQYLRISNCKELKVIDGIKNLRNLEHLRVYKTSIDLAHLADAPLPKSLAVCALYSGKSKVDQQIRTMLDSRGYLEFG
jgi:protein phosphatase 1 regulatory subunit 7